MARLFVAVEIPEARRQELAAICRGILGARWLTPDQFHLTLRFLGETAPEKMDEISQALAKVRVSKFEIGLSGVGVFPERKSRQPPSVLWAGVAPVDALGKLKTAIDGAVGPHKEDGLGFSPHLTLARFRDHPGPDLARFLKDQDGLKSPRWKVDSFHLFKTQLLATGPQHEVVRTFKLK